MASSFLRFLEHTRHTTVGRTPERVINSSQRPLPDNTQQSQQTHIHAPGGIRTRDLSKRAAADLRLRPRSHWDRLSNANTCIYIPWLRVFCVLSDITFLMSSYVLFGQYELSCDAAVMSVCFPMWSWCKKKVRWGAVLSVICLFAFYSWTSIQTRDIISQDVHGRFWFFFVFAWESLRKSWWDGAELCRTWRHRASGSMGSCG